MIPALIAVITWAELVNDLVKSNFRREQTLESDDRPEWYVQIAEAFLTFFKLLLWNLPKWVLQWLWSLVGDWQNKYEFNLLHQLVSIKLVVSLVFWETFVLNHVQSKWHWPHVTPTKQYADVRIGYLAVLVSAETILFARYHWISYPSNPYRIIRRDERRSRRENIKVSRGCFALGVLYIPNWLSISCWKPFDCDGCTSVSSVSTAVVEPIVKRSIQLKITAVHDSEHGELRGSS